MKKSIDSPYRYISGLSTKLDICFEKNRGTLFNFPFQWSCKWQFLPRHGIREFLASFLGKCQRRFFRRYVKIKVQI